MVSDRTLSSDIWTAVRNILVANAPYTTNSTTGATTAASIVAVYNDKQTSRPQLAINPIQEDESLNKFSSNEGKNLIHVTVDCYDKTTLGVDQLFDQVKYALKTTEIEPVELTSITSDYAFTTAAEQKFHMKSGTFTYDKE